MRVHRVVERNQHMAIATGALLLVLGSGLAVAATLPPGGTFLDDDGNVHEANIEAIAAAAITKGCGRHCPSSGLRLPPRIQAHTQANQPPRARILRHWVAWPRRSRPIERREAPHLSNSIARAVVVPASPPPDPT